MASTLTRYQSVPSPLAEHSDSPSAVQRSGPFHAHVSTAAIVRSVLPGRQGSNAASLQLRRQIVGCPRVRPEDGLRPRLRAACLEDRGTGPW
jgi:hypothetical protein